MHDSPPPYPGINPNYTPSYPAQPNGFNGQQPPMGFTGGAGAPPPSYPGGSSGFVPQAAGPSSYPNLPPNGFNGGFQQPGASAPPSSEFNLNFQCINFVDYFLISVTKEQEAAASAYYDPRVPNSAFVQQPQFYENPPSYSEVDHKKQN
jgi:WW domain-binding protein 2